MMMMNMMMMNKNNVGRQPFNKNMMTPMQMTSFNNNNNNNNNNPNPFQPSFNANLF